MPLAYVIMKVCEKFGFTYEYWDSLPRKEQLRYLYYITMDSKKMEYETQKAKKEGANLRGDLK